jgi:succinate-acetate transporter protein
MLVASCRTTIAVFMVFALLELAFLLLTIGAFGYVSPPLPLPLLSLSLPTHSYLSCRNITNATKAGGWIGILTAIAAWYASAAFVINNTWQMTLLPVGEFIKAAPLSEGPSEKKQEVPTPVVVGYPSN